MQTGLMLHIWMEIIPIKDYWQLLIRNPVKMKVFGCWRIQIHCTYQSSCFTVMIIQQARCITGWSLCWKLSGIVVTMHQVITASTPLELSILWWSPFCIVTWALVNLLPGTSPCYGVHDPCWCYGLNIWCFFGICKNDTKLNPCHKRKCHK